jgi:hypothetical protein
MHGEMIKAYNILLKNYKERDYLGDIGVDGRIILELSSRDRL